MHFPRIQLAAAVGVGGTLGLAASPTGRKPTASPPSAVPVSGKISLTYVQKQEHSGDFIGEGEGAGTKAAELSIDLKVVSFGNDADRAIGGGQDELPRSRTA